MIRQALSLAFIASAVLATQNSTESLDADCSVFLTTFQTCIPIESYTKSSPIPSTSTRPSLPYATTCGEKLGPMTDPTCLDGKAFYIQAVEAESRNAIGYLQLNPTGASTIVNITETTELVVLQGDVDLYSCCGEYQFLVLVGTNFSKRDGSVIYKYFDGNELLLSTRKVPTEKSRLRFCLLYGTTVGVASNCTSYRRGDAEEIRMFKELPWSIQ